MKCIFLIYFCIILHFLFTNEGFQTRILRTKSEVFSMCQQQYDITYEDLNVHYPWDPPFVRAAP